MTGSRLPLLALMLGDATGIGPEQCARVLSDGRLRDAARLVVVGDARVLAMGARDAGLTLSVHSYARPSDVDWSRPGIAIVDLQNQPVDGLARGAGSAEAG